MKQKLTKDILLAEYVGAGCSAQEIAERYDCHLGSVYAALKRHSIPTHKSQIPDPTGNKIGRLTVLEKTDGCKYLCQCECGNTTEVRRFYLNNQTIKSCGKCIDDEYLQEYIGQVSKYLTVTDVDTSRPDYRHLVCQCKCGGTTHCKPTDFRRGVAVSCGCKKYEKQFNHWKGYGEISGTYFTNMKRQAKRRGIDFDITIEYLWDLFLEQDRRCALSGQEICFVRNYSKNFKSQTASPDRIDNNRGYVEGNIQWVHCDINMMKHQHSDKYFIETCKLVAEYNS